MLLSLIESALPAYFIKIWEHQRKTSGEAGKSYLDLVMDFVKNEVETEFRLKTLQVALRKII